MIGLLSIVAALTLAPAAASPRWMALHFEGYHGLTIYAHDGESGLLARVAERAPDRWLDPDDGDRIRERRSIAGGVDVAELAHPDRGAERLLRDIGETPAPGTLTDGLLAAFRPPATCTTERTYRFPAKDGLSTIVEATICSNEQAAALDDFVRERLWERLPATVRVERRTVRSVTYAQFERVRRGASMGEVIDLLGDPAGLWPHYPDGFTMQYDPDPSAGGAALVVELDRKRSVVGVRTLTENRWPQ